MPLLARTGCGGWPTAPLTADLALGPGPGDRRRPGPGPPRRGRRAAGRRPTAVVARDPRISGEFLAAAVEAGLATSGVDVLDAGVLPTPAAAFLIADIDADFGVMVSASHNPAPDNGIKIFARGGVKLPDVVEQRIEAAMAGPSCSPTGGGVGRIRRFADAEDRYVVAPARLAAAPARRHPRRARLRPRRGIRRLARDVPRRRRRVTVIGADPDGLNINDGVGSTHLDSLRRAVLESAPTSASPTTATPTAASRWTPPATSSTATRSWRSSPWR